MAALARAMGENIDGLAPREVNEAGLGRHPLHDQERQSPRVADGTWGSTTPRRTSTSGRGEAHKEQRLLTRSPRILSVEDIEIIYENAFD